ncbi:MAG: hypothetical protein WA405_06545 [Candidatus Acidiferrales bacterium]
MMSRRNQMIALVGLLAALLVVFWFTMRNSGPGIPGVLAADTKFKPLNVQEPQLRVDLLAELKELEYSGSHRNIFVEIPLPVPMTPAQKQQEAARRFVGPVLPPPPPPLSVPVQFFGYESLPDSDKRVAFFTSGDDVLIVAEGNTFLNGFRLLHIGNFSADVEEISSGRQATIQMVPPQQPGQGASP